MAECEGIGVPEPESTKYTNQILQIIEKRIDERIGQLKFFEEHLNHHEVKFNTKKENQKLTRNAIQNKLLTFEEVKEWLK